MEIEEILSSLQFSNSLWVIITPLVFSLADIITGYIQAIINKKLSSKKMREGLLRKCLLMIMIVLGKLLEVAFAIPHICATISIYILFMEILSIIENITKAGIDLGKLKEILKIKGENNEGN